MKTKTKRVLAVRKGSVLLTERPFVYVLKSKLREERCDNCFKRNRLLKCSGCQYVYYCNRDCQRESWADHKQECNNLRRVSPRIVPDAARLLSRIIFKLQRGGDLEKGYYSETNFRRFKDLMSHYSDLKQDQKRMEHFTSLCGVLIDFVGESNLPNSAELMGIYGRMCVNGFNILDPEMLSIGTGIYLACSVIDHSCDPNAVAVFDGITIHIRAVKDMPVLDWKKVFISYIDLLNFPKDRQAELQATYYFLCDCKPCTSIQPLNVILCPNENCGREIPVKKQDAEELPQPCPSCGDHIKADTYRDYLEVEEFTRHQLEIMKDIAYLDVCKVCLKKQRGLFHSLDILHVKVLDLAFESSIQIGQWEQAVEFGQELIAGYEKYYGEYHPLLGIHYLKLGKINLYLKKFNEALNTLKNAEIVIRVTHGDRHALYRDQLLPLVRQTEAELGEV
ncbi:histone-lysine N-methyltransferase SMYD3 [Zootermopsis nevadensis]|uniref:SET and MYND domain-containing protein 3 n=1 Tax=Zootermopsis nevadensis TaxID=136037 RepID=A0A067RS12_ZOONE|nr:histone-lysine N-methyltransferase SMYD3 [Zootermopsis nevadensis]KDR23505.1 SET and MYND domain-containing protein 3 [Zootermopsis nevadensis]